MIDEFQVPEHKFKDPKLPTLHCYIVEVPKELKEAELKFKILNHDNNWTNGFMTRDTNIWLEEIHFFPEPLMEDLYSFKNFRTKNHIHDRMREVSLKALGPDGSKRSNSIFNLIEYVSFHRTEGLDNGEEVTGIRHLQFGGSGHYSIKLYKKYGILLPKNMKNTRHFWVRRPGFIEKVYERIRNMYDI